MDKTKRVLVIGASSALGGEVARQRFAAGCRVYGTCKSEGALPTPVAHALTQCFRFDITNSDDLKGLRNPNYFGGVRFDEIYYMVGVAMPPVVTTDPDPRACDEEFSLMGLNYAGARGVRDALTFTHLASDGVLVVANSALAWWKLEFVPVFTVAMQEMIIWDGVYEEFPGCYDWKRLVIWAPGAINTKHWTREGIPREVQTAVRLFAPGAMTAVRRLLDEVDRRTATGTHAAVPVLTTVDAWLTYHVPIAAAVVNQVLSGLVECDAARRGALPWRWRAVFLAPVAALLRVLGSIL